MFVAPEQRMSSSVITKMAAAACEIFSAFLETEVTSMFIKSSRGTAERSRCPARICAGKGNEDCPHAALENIAVANKNRAPHSLRNRCEVVARRSMDTISSTNPGSMFHTNGRIDPISYLMLE
jgi:hypothetical protein